MTAPSLLDELEAVVRLAEKATPGEWAIGPYGGVYKTDSQGKLQNALLVGESKSAFFENRSANEAAATQAVNFIRTHHATIAAMAKRLDAAERKVSRLTAMRNEWESDAREHLNTFGQHLPASVECLVERFDAATQEGEE
jgi:hypothetical protein